METESNKAIDILKSGGIVIFPTDTAFGIGCRIDSKEAVKRLFDIRRRPYTKPTPVLFSNLVMLQEFVLEIPKDVKEKLIDKYWPGALTLILRCIEEKVPNLVRGEGETIGARIPNHPELLKLIEKVGVPILGPSANFHGEKTPFMMQDLDAELVKLVDYVLPGECQARGVSTVIDCTQAPWKILRQGAIDTTINK